MVPGYVRRIGKCSKSFVSIIGARTSYFYTRIMYTRIMLKCFDVVLITTGNDICNAQENYI